MAALATPIIGLWAGVFLAHMLPISTDMDKAWFWIPFWVTFCLLEAALIIFSVEYAEVYCASEKSKS